MESSTSSEISTPRLTLICPTIGRSTLHGLLARVTSMMTENDEFIVVADGPCGVAELCALFPQVRYIELPARVGDFGCTPCDVGIEAATGDYVFFTGDDDVPADNVFTVVRNGLAGSLPHVFAMMHSGRILANSVACCAVSGQQIVVPRDMSRMPKMAEVQPGQWNISDWVFIDKVVRAWNFQVVFRNEIINTLHRQQNGAMS
jgi:glycosyl transferase family 2